MKTGVVPKRSTERRRANKYPGETKLAVAGKVRIPAASKEWHPLARDWYLSLRKSGQSHYYEASDWQFARYTAEMMSSHLEGRRSSMMFAELIRAMDQLLVTEASRRRSRMEIERALAPEDSDAVEAIVQQYREAMKE